MGSWQGQVNLDLVRIRQGRSSKDHTASKLGHEFCRQQIKTAYFIGNQGKPNFIHIQICWLALLETELSFEVNSWNETIRKGNLYKWLSKQNISNLVILINNLIARSIFYIAGFYIILSNKNWQNGCCFNITFKKDFFLEY